MAKQFFIYGLISIIVILFCLQFTSEAEVINSVQTCNGQTCFSNISDAMVANNGSFFLIVDSAVNPYVRKINFPLDTFSGDIILPLDENNSEQNLFKIGINKDCSKAFVFRPTEISENLNRNVKREREITLQEQTNQGTTCRCSAGTYFDGTLCITGTLNCSNTVSDPVCSCDNFNFLNSCVAQANGVKQFTKATCGTTSNLTCSDDSQCPAGRCSNGMTFQNYTCTSQMCQLIQFSNDPCSSSSSSSGICRCSDGEYFDGFQCIKGVLDCGDAVSDPVCSCDNSNFLNSCIAQANGVRKFTKATCGTVIDLNCSSNEQCPIGICPNGDQFQKFLCNGGKCKFVEYSSEPCVVEQSSSSSGSLIHIIDLTSNSVKSIFLFGSVLANTSSSDKGISTVSFLDPEGNKLIAGNNDPNAPKLNIIDSQTGEIEQSITIPDIAESIEVSPDFKKAIVIFKDLLAQSIGIYTISAKRLNKIDIPSSIFFKLDRFLSGVSFNLKGDKCVISSLDGKHVLHLVDLNNDKLTVRFLSDKFEGKTISRISPDGTSAISVGSVSEGGGIIVYKTDTANALKMRIRKRVKFPDQSDVLDVQITPDNNSVLILLLDEKEKKIKMLNMKDLSFICEYKISSKIDNSYLINDPYGRFLLSPNLQNSSVDLINDLDLAPVFRGITPLKLKKSGKVKFAIDGYINPAKFSDAFKVCFGSEKNCATSVTVSSDGKTISGTTPGLLSGIRTLFFVVKEQSNNVSTSSSGAINCLNNNTSSKYKNAFLIE